MSFISDRCGLPRPLSLSWQPALRIRWRTRTRVRTYVYTLTPKRPDAHAFRHRCTLPGVRSARASGCFASSVLFVLLSIYVCVPLSPLSRPSFLLYPPRLWAQPWCTSEVYSCLRMPPSSLSLFFVFRFYGCRFPCGAASGHAPLPPSLPLPVSSASCDKPRHTCSALLCLHCLHC